MDASPEIRMLLRLKFYSSAQKKIMKILQSRWYYTKIVHLVENRRETLIFINGAFLHCVVFFKSKIKG